MYVRETIDYEDGNKRVVLCSGDGSDVLYGTGAGKDKEFFLFCTVAEEKEEK